MLSKKTWGINNSVIDYTGANTDLILPENYSFEYLHDFKDIVGFINKNYKERTDEYNLNYTEKHLQWYFDKSLFNFIALKHKEKIIGCVSGKLISCYQNGSMVNSYEINFLCLEFDYRKKGYINYLIAEIGRLGLVQNVNNALYISHDLHANPMTKIDYYLAYTENTFSFPIDKTLRIIKNMKVDSFILSKLTQRYTTKFKLGRNFTNPNEFNNFSVVSTFTLIKCGEIVGFVSYYCLNLVSEFGNATVKQAYIYYYWYDENNITVDELFSNTFCLLHVDYIVTNNIAEMNSQELREHLNINCQINHCYYYCVKGVVENIAFTNDINPKEISLFLP